MKLHDTSKVEVSRLSASNCKRKRERERERERGRRRGEKKEPENSLFSSLKRAKISEKRWMTEHGQKSLRNEYILSEKLRK